MRLLVFSSNGAYSSDPSVIPSAGGAERALRWTAEAAAEAGHEVIYLSVDPATPSLNLMPSIERMDVLGVDVRLARPMTMPRLGAQLLARRESLLLDELKAILAEFDPDVAFTYAPAPDTWLVLRARELADSRVRVVERVSGRPWESALASGSEDALRTRTAFIRRDATLYSSRAVRDYAVSKLHEFGIVPAGSWRIADLSPAPVPAGRAALPPEAGYLFSRHRYPLSFVGRFKPGSKRQDVAIEALAELQRRGVDACIAFAGDGRLLEAMRTHAEAHGVEKRCCFAGYLAPNETAGLVEASTLGLLLTDFEGTSKAALDYLRRGVPVVMSRIPPNAELLEDERALNDLLLCNTDPISVADRVQSLLKRPGEIERARTLTDCLSLKLAKRFDPAAFVDTLAEVGAVHLVR